MKARTILLGIGGTIGLLVTAAVLWLTWAVQP
jgi:hypothetical protein